MVDGRPDVRWLEGSRAVTLVPGAELAVDAVADLDCIGLWK